MTLTTVQKDNLLVFGYVHENYNADQIVPIEITQLCYKYYHEAVCKLSAITLETNIASTNMIVLNDNEIVIATDCNWFAKSKGLYKYNAILNKAQLFIEYPTECTIQYATMSYDENNQIIYIHGTRRLTKINIKTETFTYFDTNINVGIQPRGIFIDDTFHLIGGSRNKHHMIWNDNTKQYDIIHTFHKFDEFGDGGLCSFGLIYVKGNCKIKRTILLFGGWDGNQSHDEIWYYLFESKQWILCPIKLPVSMHRFFYVLTNNQRYVIAGSFILDLEKFPHIICSKIEEEEYLRLGDGSAVMMKNGDLHVANNFGGHSKINIKDVIQSYKG